VDTYERRDATQTGHFFAEIGHRVRTVDLVPHDEFHEIRLDTESARPARAPHGGADGIHGLLDQAQTGTALSCVLQHEPDDLSDDEARWRMRLIVPHIRRAMAIGQVVDLKTAEAATFADTFDGLSAGMFLVDAGGRIVHANAAGHALVAAGDVLRTGNGRLVATDAEADRQLRD